VLIQAQSQQLMGGVQVFVPTEAIWDAIAAEVQLLAAIFSILDPLSVIKHRIHSTLSAAQLRF